MGFFGCGFSGFFAVGDNIGAREGRRSSRLLVCDKAFAVHKAGRAALPRVLVAELVSNVLDKRSLVVNRQDGVGGNIDPVFCECELVSRLGRYACICPRQEYLPRSKVKGSLATKTTSAPRSLRDIW